LTLDDALAMISDDTEFETVRVEEPDLFKYQKHPILEFALPSLGKKTLVRKNKSLNMDRYPQKDFTLNKYYFTIDK
jgi:hypothetical protein